MFIKRMRIAIFILFLNVVEVLSGSRCPSRIHIYPCTCINTKLSRRTYHTIISCRLLEETRSLEYIYPALREINIDQFILYDSFLSDNSTVKKEEERRILPIEWPTYTWIRNLEIADTDLSPCFACNARLPCRNHFTTKIEIRNSSSSEQICTVCNLTNFEEKSLEYSWLACFSNLREFQFTYGKISKIDRSFFPHKLDNLLNLNLSHNYIQSIDPGAFNNLRSLKDLDLSYNALDSFENVINGRMLLEILNLSFNKIRALSSYIITYLPNLQTLNMESNFVSTVLKWPGIPENIKYIDFTGNPFNCDCKIHWIDKSFDSNVTFHGKCSTPKKHNNSEVRIISKELSNKCGKQKLAQPKVLSRRRPSIKDSSTA